MPSVLRIVEQRIGRVDRMDSPHETIEAHWPDDSEAFALKGDERLIETTEVVENIYGSNINVPPSLRNRHFKNTDSVQSLINEYRDFVKEDAEWEGIHNSFQPVLQLKEGEDSLIQEEYYEQIKGVKATIKSRVSFVHGENNWCFLALRGTKTKSPRWYFIDESDELHTDFTDICYQLRKHLTKDIEGASWNQEALQAFVTKMQRLEKVLLPHKRKRALNVAQRILEKKLDNETDSEVKSLLRRTLNLFRPSVRSIIVDFYQFAEQWIEILQPYLDEKRKNAKRKRIVYNLRNLERDYKSIHFSKELLQKIIDNCPYTDQIDQKIASCIIGVKAS